MPEITYLKVNTSFLAFKIKQIMKDYVKRQITMYNTTYLGHSDASCSPHQPELLCYECAYVDESGSLEN